MKMFNSNGEKRKDATHIGSPYNGESEAAPPFAYAQAVVVPADKHTTASATHEKYSNEPTVISPKAEPVFSPPQTSVATTRVYHIPPPAPSGPPPPPGAPPGGVWGRNNYIGEKTAACTLFVVLFVCLPGLLLLCCPFDERDAYLAPNGVIYDASGRQIGRSHRTRFVPTNGQQQKYY